MPTATSALQHVLAAHLRRSEWVVQVEAVAEAKDRVSAVYKERGGRMWRALVGYTGDPDIASDAMSKAFARAVRDADGICCGVP